MTFYLAPALEAAHVLVVFYDFAAAKGPYSSHAGLGVNAGHTVKVLRRIPVRADMLGATGLADISKAITASPTITHCIVEAPWLSTANLQQLLKNHPNVHFLTRVHSQVGFLQVEAGAIRLIREQLLLQEHTLNFSVASNATQLCRFIETAYRSKCVYLPNLYDMERVTRKLDAPHTDRLLRISSFGAIRLLKNHTTAAAAALMIAQMRGNDLEFYINSKREEHGVGVVDALRLMFKDLPYAKLVEVPWADSASFRRVVAGMDLATACSFTETFNLVSADAAAEGVAPLVSPVVEWLPSHYQADPDDAEDIARVGNALLSDRRAGPNALVALEKFQKDAINIWKDYLSGSPTH